MPREVGTYHGRGLVSYVRKGTGVAWKTSTIRDEDQKLVNDIEDLREQISLKSLERAKLYLRARRAGMPAETIAEALGIHVDLVYRRIREAKKLERWAESVYGKQD